MRRDTKISTATLLQTMFKGTHELSESSERQSELRKLKGFAECHVLALERLIETSDPNNEEAVDRVASCRRFLSELNNLRQLLFFIEGGEMNEREEIETLLNVRGRLLKSFRDSKEDLSAVFLGK